jgi:DNA replicative helicase MCM subunit Mcm2 (Cdc46/Mcm family)
VSAHVRTRDCEPNGRSFVDTLKSAEDNIEFQATILSRFDMIFIIKAC